MLGVPLVAIFGFYLSGMWKHKVLWNKTVKELEGKFGSYEVKYGPESVAFERSLKRE